MQDSSVSSNVSFLSEVIQLTWFLQSIVFPHNDIEDDEHPILPWESEFSSIRITFIARYVFTIHYRLVSASLLQKATEKKFVEELFSRV